MFDLQQSPVATVLNIHLTDHTQAEDEEECVSFSGLIAWDVDNIHLADHGGPLSLGHSSQL